MPFAQIFFTREGVFSSKGRTLILGKCRRILLCLIPSVARALQKRSGLQGHCVNCGASCNLLFQCPHWDSLSRLCTVYDDRPNTCRYFPITPADIRDRNLVLSKQSCGFQFRSVRSTKE